MKRRLIVRGNWDLTARPNGLTKMNQIVHSIDFVMKNWVGGPVTLCLMPIYQVCDGVKVHYCNQINWNGLINGLNE